jgi:hypothetical protein
MKEGLMRLRARTIGAAAICFAGGAASAGVRTESVLASQVVTEPAASERVGAGLAVIDVTGIPSMDGLGSPNNVVIFLWIGPFNSVTGIGWDVVLQTVIPNSRRRDLTMWVRDSTNTQFTGFGIQPGSADPTPGGPTPYSSDGITKLVEFNIPPVQALADGLIRLEFSDSPDNAPGEADGLWVSGTVSLQTLFPIPTPASVTLGLLLGLRIVGLRQRRCDDNRH